MMNMVQESAALLVDRDSRGVTTLTLNRPHAFNALSAELLADLEKAIGTIAMDTTARAVVIAGSGRAFCAGHDLHEMTSESGPIRHRDLLEQCGRVMLGLQALPVPVIARVHGVATAAGCQLVATCDLAIAGASARFAVSGINLGLFCATPSVALARTMPRKPALEMLFTGTMIDAAEAERRFLINRAVPDADLDDAIEALLQSILDKPRSALSIGKAQFYRQVEQKVADAYVTAGAAMVCNLAEPSAQERITEFIQRRNKA